jgi:hypothetical protein
MYNGSKGQRIDESAELFHQLKELTAEKSKYEKNDVNKVMDEHEKRALEHNLLKMMYQEDDELAEIKRQSNVLMEELDLLK